MKNGNYITWHRLIKRRTDKYQRIAYEEKSERYGGRYIELKNRKSCRSESDLIQKKRYFTHGLVGEYKFFKIKFEFFADNK
jgi:hypothetical protein